MEHLGQRPLSPEAPIGGLFGQAPNYYRVLDVDQRATRMEIREAYLRLKATYGAGSAALYSLMSEEEAESQMALVEEAFRILNDDVSRRAFDQEVNRAEARSVPVATQPQSTAAGANASDEAYIRTVRSALPIIKLKAPRAGSHEMQAKLAEIIASGDPGDGDLYRRMREALEVSEDEICERTKVSIAYIHAIEANRFDRLPQAVYVKGFLRSYFRYLCVPDAEAFVAAFSTRLVDWQVGRKA